MVQASASAGIWLDDEWRAHLTRRLGQAVAVSLALHLGGLLVVAWVRLPQHGERPLASIEITLASMPTPPVKVTKPQTSRPVEPIKPPKSQPVEVIKPQKSQPKVVDLPNVPAPAKMAPVPPPVAPVKPSNDVTRDVLKGIELPPDAPKFGDYAPTEEPKKAQLKLPEVPVFSEPEQLIKKEQDLKPQPLLTEDLNKELAEELKKFKKFDLPKPTQAEVSPKPVPQVETKAPSVKAVDATLKIPGMAPGSNAYLGLVRQRISSFWSAPPVDVTGQTYAVVVQFRLHRNGSVTGVAIERSSGNEYYDLAGKRAVLSAIPLPAFPPDLTEPYFDAHFTFTVGMQQG
ncbi:MAG: TonB family protein [Nitrospiraceae bacterium]